MNQPSRFLPLAQEDKKLATKLKEEEEASQWLGIPIEKILNDSFTEQLNYMSCHRDGGMSQGDTRHSMPPVRRWGGFNFDN